MSQTFATRGEKMWFNDLAESLRIRRFNVKYILKLALVAVIPALLVVGAVNAAQHHHRKAGHRAHHRSSHHAHSSTRHRNPNQ
jgi:hypothetical protein